MRHGPHHSAQKSTSNGTPQTAEQFLVDLGLDVALCVQVEVGPAADDGVVSSFDLNMLEQFDYIRVLAGQLDCELMITLHEDLPTLKAVEQKR
jgi:hypothetical protein